MMTVYLEDIPLPDAMARFNSALEKGGLRTILGIDRLPVDQNLVGRILAEPVFAVISAPHYHSSAMDGFAVRASDTEGASLTMPITLPVADTSRDDEQRTLQCQYLDTGDPLPVWYDAVIPIENVEPLNENHQTISMSRQPAYIRIREAVSPWTHVRILGEDIVATELVLPAGKVLTAVDLGAIAASGNSIVSVSRKPRVAIIPTGTELVPVGKPVDVGDIIEYNSIVLAAQVREWGGVAVRFEIIPDRLEEIIQVVLDAAKEYDLVLLLAGSSAGSEDFSVDVVEAVGEVLVHGVAVRPGHPVILGMVYADTDSQSEAGLERTQIPIVGIPGYPVSAALTGEIFVKPMIETWLGTSIKLSPKIKAILTKKVTSPAGDDDYIRVVIGKVGEDTLASPLSRGAGLITSLSRADGYVIVPRGSQGLSAGDRVDVVLLRKHVEIDKTIFSIGSHDMTLDLLTQYLADHDRRLVSSNVGSLGGLIAIKKGQTHLAGSHLLDPNSGEYNLAYMKKYLENLPVVLVGFVTREQGLIVKKGNPKGIKSIQDLMRSDVRFINRQPGSGTRVLLDYHLQSAGISYDKINGYQREVFTHLAIAAGISSGRSDCGLGISAAAESLDLDFIPLFHEVYDLVVPQTFYTSDLLAPMFDIIRDSEFRKAVSGIRGYAVDRMGDIIAKIPE